MVDDCHVSETRETLDFHPLIIVFLMNSFG